MAAGLRLDVAAGLGTMTRIGALPPGTFAPRLSPDGGASDYDVWAFTPADRTQRPPLATPTSAQMSSRFSPDGKWLAYQSNETDRHEIYVEPS